MLDIKRIEDYMRRSEIDYHRLQQNIKDAKRDLEYENSRKIKSQSEVERARETLAKREDELRITTNHYTDLVDRISEFERREKDFKSKIDTLKRQFDDLSKKLDPKQRRY